MSIEQPIIYFALDIERATGIENLLTRYAVVTPWVSELSGKLEAQGTRVFVLERDCPEFIGTEHEDALKEGTYGMMKIACVKNFVQKFAGSAQPNILVLKNSDLIEEECAKNGWKLLAPKASAAKLFEDKITQWQLLHEAVKFPQTLVTDLAHVAECAREIGFPLVMQFNAGHSGGGTHIVARSEDFAPFKKLFPHRPVRLVKFIRGNTYTLNALVAKEGAVYSGSLSKQLTGLPEATSNPASTVGNDFGAAAREVSPGQGNAIAGIAKRIGQKMYKMNYAGLFGIDVVVEADTGNVYCIEVNTHQPASISFEAKLHQMIKKEPLMFLCICDMMDGTFSPSAEELPPLFLPGNVGQIIYRNKTDAVVRSEAIVVPEGGLRTRMKIVKPNEELFRMQSSGIAE